MNINEPWQPPSPPKPNEAMVTAEDPRVDQSHLPGQLPCPKNPPPPVGWKYWGGKVPSAGCALAQKLAYGVAQYKMGTFVQVYLDGQLFAIRVEWHDVEGRTGRTGGCRRGANFMVPTTPVTAAVATSSETTDSVAPAATPVRVAFDQNQIVHAVRSGGAEFTWLPMDEFPELEVMARPAKIAGEYVAVSARTAQQCADILSDASWLVQLSTVAIEDWIWEHASVKPAPLLISPTQLNIACAAALAKASAALTEKLADVDESTLVAYGKNWVRDARLGAHPGRAANYGMPDPKGLYKSADGKYKLWQPLGFAHNIDHFDYSQLLRLVRTRRGDTVHLPSVEPDTDAGSQLPTIVAAVPNPRPAFRVLHSGLQGDDVTAWQQFLVGQGFLQSAITGTFDRATLEATLNFQRSQGLKDDGWVGNQTMGRALQLGYGVVTQPGSDHAPGGDITSGEDGPDWPSPPINLSPLSQAGRMALFGVIEYVPLENGAIRIVNDFAENLTMVTVPELVGVTGANAQGHLTLHRKAAEPLQNLFAAWKREGLLNRVLTFGGAYNPRYVRGSTTTLSPHAWGTAFDINVPWNPLGAAPALKGKKGCVRELVALANELGWYWGGHFRSRLDGMHFELCVG